MTFAQDLAKIPFTARGTDAAGFLTPFHRAAGHITFAYAASADDRGLMTEDEVRGELEHAKEHWNALAAPAEVLSVATLDLVANLGAAVTSAHTEFPVWTAEQRTSNLRELTNRFAHTTATLDRELLGIRDSDPGYQL